MIKEKLNQYAILSLLAIALIASGCMSNNQTQSKAQQQVDKSQKQAEKLLNCSEVSFNIVFASSSRAVVQNTGEVPTGEIKVTWKFKDGRKESKMTKIDVGQQKRIENSLKGSFQKLNAKSSNCQDITATYT